MLFWRFADWIVPLDISSTITVRGPAGEEILELDEFEARVESGEIGPATEVNFPPVTGAGFVRAAELDAFRGLYEPKALYFRRAFTLGRLPLLTLALSLANLAVFLLELRGGPVDTATMVAFGAKAGPLLHDLGELWRLLTANFVHRDWAHIGFNLFVLFHFGAALENAYRPLDYLYVLLAAALGTTALSYTMTDAVSAGASGMAYGMLGGAMVFGLKYRRILPERYRTVLGGAVVPTVLVFLYIGWTSSGVDNWGHVGGLLAGALATAPLRPRLLGDAPRGRRLVLWRIVPLAAVVGGLVLAQPILEDRLPRLEVQREERFGLEVPVPAGWRPAAERLGPISWSNGLAGPVRASLSAGARFLDEEPALDVEARRWIAEELYGEEREGRIENVLLSPIRYAHVGGLLGVAVDAAFGAEGVRTALTAHFFARGHVLYSLVLARPSGLEGYARVFERIVAGVRPVEPAFLRAARGRALLAPDDAEAWRAVAVAAERVGAAKEARRALERAMALAPEDPLAVAHLASLTVEEGLPREACRLAARARSLAPQASQTLEALADCALGQHDAATAEARLAEAVAAAPDDARLKRRLWLLRADRAREDFSLARED